MDIHSIISRKNIYATAGMMLVIAAGCYAFFPAKREVIYFMIFNPFWPVTLGVIEIYLQTKEKETAEEDKKRISAVGGVLRGRLDNRDEHELIKSVMDALTQKDLMTFNANKIEEMEVDRSVEAAGMITGNSVGVDPN